jgi:hypothetical protein
MIYKILFCGDTWHGLLIRSTTNFENQFKCLRVFIGLEQDLAGYNFSKHTGCGPDINSIVVVSKTKKQFRTAIPESDYFDCVHCIFGLL